MLLHGWIWSHEGSPYWSDVDAQGRTDGSSSGRGRAGARARARGRLAKGVLHDDKVYQLMTDCITGNEVADVFVEGNAVG